MPTDSDRRLHSQDAESAIDAFADEHQAAWTAYRRERHCAPEASGEETETSHSVCERLKSLGIPAFIPERGVGVVGDLLFGDATIETPAIAIRADIDALRMSDRKDVGYASIKDGLAHACGHDVHTTIVLGVAEVLTHLGNSRSVDVPSGRIRFLFQAAEETCDGAAWMIEDGMLAGVRSILGVHVEPNLLAGQLGLRYGVFTACVDEVFITVSGRGGHAARPHSTTDPIQAAAMLTSNLYQMLPRQADVRDASVFTVCQINGGHTSNVIPDEVSIAGTLRTTDAEGRERLMQRINDISQSIATATGNSVDVDFRHPLGSVINSAHETSAIEISARQVIRDRDIVLLDRPSMGGEDFAMYLDHCSGSQMRLGCATSQPWPHLHSPVFDIDESAIAFGVRILARAILQLMTK
ncbi:MAG: amidohydrolase [Fuerstiella sp.]|nr:amidohydrolase [Fuerstiella sp.]